MRDPRQIIIRPLITEKGTRLRDAYNHYGFVVNKRANKVEIGKAVESIFNVKVEKVRTANALGKNRRVGRHMGKKSDWKKAVVTLIKGQKIEVFEGM